MYILCLYMVRYYELEAFTGLDITQKRLSGLATMTLGKPQEELDVLVIDRDPTRVLCVAPAPPFPSVMVMLRLRFPSNAMYREGPCQVSDTHGTVNMCYKCIKQICKLHQNCSINSLGTSPFICQITGFKTNVCYHSNHLSQ